MGLASVIDTDTRMGLFRLTTLVTLAVLLADVASKNWALSAVGGGHVDLGLISLVVVENDGLAFSAGAGALSSATVLALRLGALAVILLLAWRYGPERLRYTVGFALLLGGGLGNATDIVFRNGAVVDFIRMAPIPAAVGGHVVAGGIVLNLADVWILSGLVLLYPLFRGLGLSAQRRMKVVESRMLGLDEAGAEGRR